jgi:tetratricopeptide (TPR) repeat protein
VEGAIRSYREAIRIDPKFALAHNNLGWALQGKGDLDGAIAAYKEALRFDPKQQYALNNLPRAQRLRQLQVRLPNVLASKDKPKNPAEACEFARLCALPFQKRYVAAAMLYADAFAADPKLAADLTGSHHYNAACYAARAGTGQGKDASKLDATQRAEMRYRALGWLQDDLAAHARQLVLNGAISGKPSYQALLNWQKDAELATVRDATALSKLPEAEQVAWRNLWAQVDSLLARVKPAK